MRSGGAAHRRSERKNSDSRVGTFAFVLLYEQKRNMKALEAGPGK